MFTAKGYFTSDGYVGLFPDGSSMLFPTQSEYAEYLCYGKQLAQEEQEAAS